MEKNMVRFEKKIKLNMDVDFEKSIKDDFYELLRNMYNNQKTTMEIRDFSHLFTMDNITAEARTRFLNTKCNIKFTNMVINYSIHHNDRPFSLSKKVLSDFKHIELNYVVFSDYYTTYKAKDSDILYLEKDGIKYEFNLERLKECRIMAQNL